MIARSQMFTNPEPKSLLFRCFLERADDVALWSRCDRIPARLILGIPKVKSIMMYSHTAEIFRSGLLVEAQQMVRIESFGCPGGNHIFESDLGGMSIRLHVVLVLLAALDIHVARIPVAVLGSRLRSPVCPNAELGVTIPVRNLPFP